ncbi:hypothetical protein [Chitinophaga sancti]|uniref:Hint domain-containing protein n=1 Tax=Chitinophaga sancti TaxID=1004 RepID=A0A1K1LX25_9BACT|nr:hypothetical protein [Chitinophaga sancti]WQD64775.1 hypothetical protein U0033_10250 [Chitinophaga sancti]WQG89601.1 hypothetical protein SR876_32220 [Chitinophaga sancti]SFW15402.1 hypothetical protein SAMN05661012_00290 [Chitinophaga sancti]
MAPKKSTVTAGDDPSWNKQCLENIKKLGGTLCPQEQCEDMSVPIHMICNCLPPYLNGCLNNPLPGCCSYGPSSPVWVANPKGGCYCCCGMAPGAAVAVSKTRSIAADQLKKGDTIFVPKDTSLRQWTSVTLQFVSLSKTSTGNPQVSIQLRDEKGKESTLIVGERQLLMMPDRKFKEARKIVPGMDQLVNKDGQPMEVSKIITGVFGQFISYIASSAAPASEPEGHLVSLEGIIGGDYALSLGIAPGHLADNHDQLPNIGTDDYNQRYPHLS